MTHTAPTRTYDYFSNHTNRCLLDLTRTVIYCIIQTEHIAERKYHRVRYDRRGILHDQPDSRKVASPSGYRLEVDCKRRTRSLSGDTRISYQPQRLQSVYGVSQKEAQKQDTKIAGLNQLSTLLAFRMLPTVWTTFGNTPTTVCAYCTWFFRTLQGTDGERHVQTMTTRLFTHPTSLTLAPFARQTGGAA